MHCVQFVICESERVIFIFSNDALVMCVCVRVGMCVCVCSYVINVIKFCFFVFIVKKDMFWKPGQTKMCVH